MQTVILKSYDEKIHAVAEFAVSSAEVKLKFSVRGLNTPGIHKLFLMSSLKPSNEPVIADTLELKDGAYFMERSLTLGDVAYRGYYPTDMDTFVVARKDGNSYFAEAVGFSRLSWDVYISLEAVSKKGIPAYSPCESTQYSDVCKEVLEEIENFCSKAPKSRDVPIDGMEWYVIEKLPADVSAYRHILTPKAKNMIKSDGFPLLFGIQREGLTAFAHKSYVSNPFENADDCTVKSGDYYIVGIRFKADGQYFERID